MKPFQYFVTIPGQALSELSKEKTSQKTAENHTQQFLKSLNFVESRLAEQINYLTQVSTGQPHEVRISLMSFSLAVLQFIPISGFRIRLGEGAANGLA